MGTESGEWAVRFRLLGDGDGEGADGGIEWWGIVKVEHVVPYVVLDEWGFINFLIKC